MKLKTLNRVALLGATALVTMAPWMSGNASSHREAPNITRFPTVDSTDFYAFKSYEPSREAYVTLIANYIPLQDGYGGPNYFALDSSALYEIHVDNDGDAKEDMTFQFRFNHQLANKGEGIKLTIGPTGNSRDNAVALKHVGGIGVGNNGALGFNESYTLNVVHGDRRKGHVVSATNAQDNSRVFVKPYDNVGNKTFGSQANYEKYARQYVYDINIPQCSAPGKVFVGQRKESFAVNLGETFDLVNYVPVEGDSAPGAGDAKGFPGGITQNKNNDDLGDKNITSFALEVPVSCLKGSGNGVIGAWTTASLRQGRILNPQPSFKKPEINGGPWVQVSRLSNPLVNELVIGLKDKDLFNASEPKNDGQFADYVTHPTLPALLNVLFKDAVNTTLGANISDLAPTNFPRNDLVTTFLTGFSGVNQLGKVTAAEMIRLNTAIAATPADQQSTFGVVGNDLAGFPNGRRPGDDVVDIALRVSMGRLCYDIPVNGTATNLGLCAANQASVGNVPFTDGAPISSADFDPMFPYLRTPIAGSPN